MDTNYTTRSQEAISGTMQAAAAAGNPQIETAHLLAELLSQVDGVAPALLAAAVGENGRTAVGAAARRALTGLPSSAGATTGRPQPSRALLAAVYTSFSRFIYCNTVSNPVPLRPL